MMMDLHVCLQPLLSFDNNYFMDVADGGLQCISMQNVKDLLEANYVYLSGVCVFHSIVTVDHFSYMIQQIAACLYY